MQTYTINLTLEEVETLERALITYKNKLATYEIDVSIQYKNIDTVIQKLNESQ